MFWRKLVPMCSNLFSVLFPVNMPLCASTGPVLARCCQHRTSTGPVLATNGMFIGLMSICRGPWLFYLYLLLVVGCIILVCNMLCLYVQCVASICVASLPAICHMATCNCAAWLRAMCCPCIVCNVLGGVYSDMQGGKNKTYVDIWLIITLKLIKISPGGWK